MHFPKLGNQGRADYHFVHPRTAAAETWFNECAAGGGGDDGEITNPGLPQVPGSGHGECPRRDCRGFPDKQTVRLSHRRTHASKFPVLTRALSSSPWAIPTRPVSTRGTVSVTVSTKLESVTRRPTRIRCLYTTMWRLFNNAISNSSRVPGPRPFISCKSRKLAVPDEPRRNSASSTTGSKVDRTGLVS